MGRPNSKDSKNEDPIYRRDLHGAIVSETNTATNYYYWNQNLKMRIELQQVISKEYYDDGKMTRQSVRIDYVNRKIENIIKQFKHKSSKSIKY